MKAPSSRLHELHKLFPVCSHDDGEVWWCKNRNHTTDIPKVEVFTFVPRFPPASNRIWKTKSEENCCSSWSQSDVALCRCRRWKICFENWKIDLEIQSDNNKVYKWSSVGAESKGKRPIRLDMWKCRLAHFIYWLQSAFPLAFLFFPPSQPFYLQRSLNPKNYSLHFNPVKLIDSGEYICTINDKPTEPIDLLVQDVPEAPGRPMITGFTSRSVNLSWAQVQEPKNAPVTDFILETRYVQVVTLVRRPLQREKIRKKHVESRESFIAIHNLPT